MGTKNQTTDLNDGEDGEHVRKNMEKPTVKTDKDGRRMLPSLRGSCD
jgi:hypothetical protein